MALRGDRRVIDEDGGWFSNAVQERGGIVSVVTAGSGAAMDDAAALVDYVANPSGISPVGVLMQDVVNKDLTQTKQNNLKQERQVGGKVHLVTKGTVVTDWLYPGQTPVAGDNAYVVHSGYISNTDSIVTDSSDSNRKIGKFDSVKDENGFAKISVNIP